MQLGLGLGLTCVQQAGGGGGGGETLEVIDFNGNEEIPEYVNNNVVTVTTYVDFAGCTEMLLFRALSLETVAGVSGFNCAGSGIVVADCPLLTSVFGYLNFNACVDFTTPVFSALGTVQGIACTECAGLTAFPLDSLTTIGDGGLNFVDCTGLITFALPVLSAVADGASIQFTGCALDQSSVDAILVALAATSFANGGVQLDAGTNAAPSATGLAAKATLEGRGCTVFVNNPAPVLSDATGTATGATTADISVSTDTPDGELRYVVTQSGTAPTQQQITDGQNHLGDPADEVGNMEVSTIGQQDFQTETLVGSTEYWAHFMQESAALVQSDVVSSASFTTDAP